MTGHRTIEVKALTRVEGEGALFIQLEGRQVTRVELNIYEPPRFFEAFLRGRAVREVPDITARICGICPVAYQMSSCHALEKALGLTVTPEIRAMRRLLYCGEWIESHALHIHLLHAPDFLGYESGIRMAADHREVVERGLRLKKIGNRLLEIIGARAIHPINVTVGGFYRAPSWRDLQDLLPDLEWGWGASADVLRLVTGFDYPDLTQPYESVSLRHAGEYAMNEGRVISSRGLDIAVEEFEQHFAEQQLPHSTALHCVRMPGRTAYLVGPVARWNLCGAQVPSAVRALAEQCGIDRPLSNNFYSIAVRALELLVAFDEAIRLVKQCRGKLAPSRVDFVPRPGSGCHATEAPRGLLYHRYRIGEDGLIAEARIIPPTSQNQGQLEADLRSFLPRLLEQADAEVTRQCEHLIRNYDPCISCATHFLRLEWSGPGRNIARAARQ